MRHTADPTLPRGKKLLIDLFPPRPTLQPALHLLLLQATPGRNLSERGKIAHIPLLLKIPPLQSRHDQILLRHPFPLLDQVNQPVRVARVPDLAPEFEIDAHGFPHLHEAGVHGRHPLGAEAGIHVFTLVDAGAGHGRVELVGQPGCGEGVGGGWVAGSVEGDACGELFGANVAPGADCVCGYGYGEVSHAGEVGALDRWSWTWW